MIDEQYSESADCGIVRPTPKRLLPPAGLTLRFSGSPTQLTIKSAHRRVRCKRLLGIAVEEYKMCPASSSF